MEKKHNEKVSQELKEEKEKQKNQRKIAKDLHNAMQNANDSLIKSQHNIRNKLEGISHFALDQYIQKLAFGVIAPPTSNEDSDQSPLKVRSRNPRLGSNNYMSLYFMTNTFFRGTRASTYGTCGLRGWTIYHGNHQLQDISPPG